MIHIRSRCPMCNEILRFTEKPVFIKRENGGLTIGFLDGREVVHVCRIYTP